MTADRTIGALTRTTGETVEVAIYPDRYEDGTLALIARNACDPSDVVAEVTTPIDGPLFLADYDYDVIVSDKCSDEVYDLLLDSGLIAPCPYTQARRYPGADLSQIHSLTETGYEWITNTPAAA